MQVNEFIEWAEKVKEEYYKIREHDHLKKYLILNCEQFLSNDNDRYEDLKKQDLYTIFSYYIREEIRKAEKNARDRVVNAYLRSPNAH